MREEEELPWRRSNGGCGEVRAVSVMEISPWGVGRVKVGIVD